MEISRYLAMTAAELENFSVPDGYVPAYMACHFSPYTTGLSNIPSTLSPTSMLILNDRTPICGHDPHRIAAQLEEAMEQLAFESLLLDLQRPENQEAVNLCKILTEVLSCPVGVSDLYAADLDCPVFLAPAPLDQPLAKYLCTWEEREIWLDTATDAACITLTAEGSSLAPLPFSQPPKNAFTDETLHCCYRAEVFEDKAVFHLWRDFMHMEELVQEAQALGVTKAIGLFQELCT